MWEKTTTKDDKTSNYIGTSHQARKDQSLGRIVGELYKDHKLREINHSHPTNAAASSADIRAFEPINNQLKAKYIYKIYYVPHKRYIPILLQKK